MYVVPDDSSYVFAPDTLVEGKFVGIPSGYDYSKNIIGRQQLKPNNYGVLEYLSPSHDYYEYGKENEYDKWYSLSNLGIPGLSNFSASAIYKVTVNTNLTDGYNVGFQIRYKTTTNDVVTFPSDNQYHMMPYDTVFRLNQASTEITSYNLERNTSIPILPVEGCSDFEKGTGTPEEKITPDSDWTPIPEPKPVDPCAGIDGPRKLKEGKGGILARSCNTSIEEDPEGWYRDCRVSVADSIGPWSNINEIISVTETPNANGPEVTSYTVKFRDTNGKEWQAGKVDPPYNEGVLLYPNGTTIYIKPLNEDDVEEVCGQNSEAFSTLKTNPNDPECQEVEGYGIFQVNDNLGRWYNPYEQVSNPDLWAKAQRAVGIISSTIGAGSSEGMTPPNLKYLATIKWWGLDGVFDYTYYIYPPVNVNPVIVSSRILPTSDSICIKGLDPPTKTCQYVSQVMTILNDGQLDENGFYTIRSISTFIDGTTSTIDFKRLPGWSWRMNPCGNDTICDDDPGPDPNPDVPTIDGCISTGEDCCPLVLMKPNRAQVTTLLTGTKIVDIITTRDTATVSLLQCDDTITTYSVSKTSFHDFFLINENNSCPPNTYNVNVTYKDLAIKPYIDFYTNEVKLETIPDDELASIYPNAKRGIEPPKDYPYIPSLQPCLLIGVYPGTVTSGSADRAGYTVDLTWNDTNDLLIAPIDLASYEGKVIIGYRFNYMLELPRFYFRGETTDYTASLTISRIKTALGYSGDCELQLRSVSTRPHWSKYFSATQANIYEADDTPITEASLHALPVHQRSDDFYFRITSDSPFPLSTDSVTWEGNYSPRYYRRM
jgi:hypothetical protein